MKIPYPVFKQEAGIEPPFLGAWRGTIINPSTGAPWRDSYALRIVHLKPDEFNLVTEINGRAWTRRATPYPTFEAAEKAAEYWVCAHFRVEEA